MIIALIFFNISDRIPCLFHFTCGVLRQGLSLNLLLKLRVSSVGTTSVKLYLQPRDGMYYQHS